MAEDVQEKNTAEEDEAEALERLLQEEGTREEEAGEVEQAGGKSKKLILFLAVGAVLVFGGVGVFLFTGSDEEEPATLEDLQTEGEPAEAKVEKKPDGIQNLDIPNMYPLEPFFLPLKDKKKETGQFIHVRVNLQMSNKKLGAEIEKVLPLIRQTIYEILARKRPKDFDNKRKPIKERLKREIIASTNTLLITGSGKIDDVFFAEFMLR